jgi:hypothetical protein
MSVGRICGPIESPKIREIGQTARLSSRSLGDFTREEGGHGRRDSTWSVRPADARAGFSSIVLAGSSWLCRDGTTDQLDISLILEASDAARGTQAPGIDDVSHD